MVNGDPTADPLQREIAELQRRLAEHERRAARLQTQQAPGELLYHEARDYAYFLLDSEGRITDWDERAADLFGFAAAEVLLHPWGRLFPGEGVGHRKAEQLLGSVRQQCRIETETALLRHDGSRCWARLVLHTLPESKERAADFFVLVQDVTALKRTEAQLQQSHKMESIGRLAGGVAHDFNNLLTVINGYSEMLAGNAALDDQTRRLAAEIKRAGERAAALTQQLLAFSRQQVVSRRILDLNAVIREAEKLLRRLIGENIDLVFDLDPNLGRVRADLAQIEQVVINLAVNARDAMGGGGRLTITTHNIDVDLSVLTRHAAIAPGRYVVVRIADTGCGMDEATLARLFEPFFTTKEVGKGTGLGLATIYGIIKQSQGHIDVASVEGRGTTFDIYLPHCAEAEGAVAPASGTVRTTHGNETVLLVEDEQGVRDMARMTLQLNGYHVLVAADGDEALAVARNRSEPLHLLLTDVVMPRLGGRRLAEELLREQPSLKVLFISGYADAVTHADALPEGAFLQKPFTPTVLAQKVRQVLDR